MEADPTLDVRPWHVRLFALLFMFGWVALFFGYVDLLTPVLQEGSSVDEYLLEAGWGALYTFLVGVPLASLLVNPRWVAPIAQVATAGIAVGALALVVPESRHLIPAIGLLGTAGALYVMVRSAGRTSFADDQSKPEPSTTTRMVMRVLAAVASPPLVLFAADMVQGRRERREPTDSISWGFDHWPMQGSLAIALALGAWLATAPLSGWVVTNWTVAATAGWMGGWSMAYPDEAGSFGSFWGAAAVAWALLFVAAGLVRQRGHRNASATPPTLVRPAR